MLWSRNVLAVWWIAASCLASPVRGQPRPGNADGDVDVDLVDIAGLQTCFTGSITHPDFAPPADSECLIQFDSDGDGDFDLDDFELLRCAIGGPGVSLPAVAVDAPASPTRSTILKLRGQTAGWPSVVMTGAQETVVAPVSDCTFAATVELQRNRVNHLFVTGVLADATTSTPTPLTVIHDEQPPTLFLDFPTDGSQITTDVTDVAGRVGDVLSGFDGLRVWVNGRAAEVDIGIGTNGTFFLPGLRLNQDGPTPIEALASDALGNTAITRIDVTRVTIGAGQARMEVVSGNRQTAQVGTVLPDPIVVRVSDTNGVPFANKIVTFDVTRSNGRLTVDGTGGGSMKLQARTDPNGKAGAFWRLGFDAGCGNNRVEVKSTSIAGTTFFCASGTPAPPAQLNIGSGNNQRAEAGGPAPEPLRVWVSDACNGVPNVPVTFTVTRGGGLVNGRGEVIAFTGNTGHAQVDFTLGPDPGNNIVEASFPTNPTNPARFVIFGVRRDETQPTSFSGIVLNNNGQPIWGAICTLSVGGTSVPPVQSDIDGRFRFDDIPGSGPADLHIDGLPAFHVGGAAGTNVGPGSFPALHFEPVIIPKAANALSIPILLPPLNSRNARLFDNTKDVELTVEGIAGLRMIVKAGSMTRADGSVPSPADPAVIALNQVFFDKVPMPMPDGAAPPFAWTLQPAGATFDPPVAIVYPNMTGWPAGGVMFFLSFNHDTMRFEIVATGAVTDDGANIVSDPGAGISTAGWGCNCPPYSVTGDCCNCNDCETCVNGNCQLIICGPCQTCQNGACVSTCTGCRTCQNGVCVSGCNACQTCQNNACVSTCGECLACVDGTCQPDDGAACALANDLGQCIQGVCSGGKCIEAPGVADAGPLECCPGTPCPEQCQTCSPAGRCDPKPDGSSCEDGQSCTLNMCVDGVCKAEDICPVCENCVDGVCQATPEGGSCGPCRTCDSQGFCSGSLSDLSPCDADGDPCTRGECDSGICSESPRCPDLCAPCVDGLCQPLPACPQCQICDGGNCVADEAANFLFCTDGDSCTLDDFCLVGACIPGSPRPCPPPTGESAECWACIDGSCQRVPEGTSCGPCRRCFLGVCDPSCSFLDDECNVGMCDQSSGFCLPQPRPDGTLCTDLDDCTDDACQNGTCVSTPIVPPPGCP